MELTTDALNTLMPLGTTLGLELVSADPQTVVGTVRWHERLTTAGGALHDGTLMALADSVGGGRTVSRTTQTQPVLVSRP